MSIEKQKMPDEAFRHELDLQGPGVLGAEMLSPDQFGILGGSIKVPGHEGVNGRVTSVRASDEHGTLAIVSWQDELDGRQRDAFRAFKVDDLAAFQEMALTGTEIAQAPQTAIEAIEQGVEESTVHLADAVGETTRQAVASDLGSVGLQEFVMVEQMAATNEEDSSTTPEVQERERRQALEGLTGHFQNLERIARNPGPSEEKDSYINRMGQGVVDGFERAGKPTAAGLLAEAMTAGHIREPDFARNAVTRLMGHFDELLLKGKASADKDAAEIIELRNQLESFAQSVATIEHTAVLNEANRMMRVDTERLFDNTQDAQDVKVARATRALYANGILAQDPNGGDFMRANFRELIEKVV
jgi:hypothetical protein